MDFIKDCYCTRLYTTVHDCTRLYTTVTILPDQTGCLPNFNLKLSCFSLFQNIHSFLNFKNLGPNLDKIKILAYFAIAKLHRVLLSFFFFQLFSIFSIFMDILTYFQMNIIIFRSLKILN